MFTAGATPQTLTMYYHCVFPLSNISFCVVWMTLNV